MANPKRWLGHIPRWFAEMRPGESGTALLLTLNVFVLLFAYYLLKVAREPLILLGGGAEVKSYAAAGQAVLLVFVALGYGALARRAGRVRLISTVTVFFAANLVLFVLLGTRDVPLGVPFFLWVGIFNMTAVAQFWAFAADIYDEERGKRIFPILGIGSSLGAVAGSWTARRAIVLGPWSLMLIAAVLLLACVALTVVVDRRELGRARAPAARPVGGGNGFSILLHDHYLLAIGCLLLVINWVNTSGEYILDRTLLASAASDPAPRELIGRFKATYFAWVNGAGVLLQTCAVARAIKLLGVRGALFVMPAVSLLGYGSMAVAPVLGVVLAGKIAENSLDYSLQNTARHALWLRTSREAKYKVKQIVDSFLVRVGDVMSAGLVALGAALGLGTRGFAAANVGLVLVWFGVLAILAREHRRRAETEAA